MNGQSYGYDDHIQHKIGPLKSIGEEQLESELLTNYRLHGGKKQIKHHIADLKYSQLFQPLFYILFDHVTILHVNLNGLQSENDHDQENYIYDLKPVEEL